MMSSSQHLDPLPTVQTRSRRLPLSPDEAAAVMADNDFGRGVRVLGPADPGTSGRVYASDAVQPGFRDPILQLGGIVTVNSSVNSVAHVPAFTGGAGGGGGGVGTVIGGVTGASTISGTTAATTGTVGGVAAPTNLGSGGAVVFTPSATAITPTSAALPVTSGAFAAGPGTPSVATGAIAATGNTGTLTPTVSSSAVATPTTAISPIAAGTARANATTNGTVRTTNGTTRSVTAAGTVGGASASATVAPIRVTQDANGKVIVTNANTTRTGNSNGKRQQ